MFQMNKIMPSFRHLSAIVLAVSCLGAGCSMSTQRQATTTAGQNYRTAIRLEATNQGDCLMAQYEWIKSHFPFACLAEIDDATGEVSSHRTEEREGRIYSVFSLRLENGTTQQVYFDVTDCVGKRNR
jgi:hypothetical protein